MNKTCPACSRINPEEASFCYFDGVNLPGTARNGRLNAGTMPFSHPFVFANGESCRDFNQLIMSCQRNWGPACELLQKGTLQQFLKTMGRADLARAAAQAVAALDADRALDELLGKFPGEVLQPPKLMLEPTQVNLGQTSAGKDTTFDLVLTNLGMRLLMGTVTTDCEWLTLGDGPGQKQKMFQTTGEVHVPVKVKGQKLRAGPKTLVGRLTVESNAGAGSVKVQVDVPIVPFPSGILQGAVTPREVALKAKQFPKDAAMLFEQGAVGDWYRSNGWIYPVEGPSGSGLGAVQQFFEALGLTKPPRVEISDANLQFKATMGDKIPGRLKVTTPDKRPVFAHALCDQPWLTFAPPQFQGTVVRLPFEVVVPAHPGQTLTAKVTVRANGNQRFQVPVTLAIDDVFLAAPVVEAEIVTAEIVAVPPSRGAASSSSASPFTGFEVQRGKPRTTRRDEDEDDQRITARRPRKKQPEPESRVVGTFGMGRLVYWASAIGGWSAFIGWLFAELILGRLVSGGSVVWAMVMVLVVATSLGAGLSQVEGLLTSQWKSQLRRLGIGALGGFLGGLVGGTFAFLIYQPLQNIAVVGFLSRVLGWTLMGLAIGIFEGILQRHWRKFRNGLIGGGVGGFLGGLLFTPVSWLVGSDVSGRAFAFVLLGLFIGLFLSLVQVLLKEAWLTVEEGFRPGRQLILNQPVATMGTSEKASLIFIAYGAKGVEPIHLRIRQKKGGEFVLTDNDSRGGTLLNGDAVEEPTALENGDVIQLGINKVRFHERVRAKSK